MPDTITPVPPPSEFDADAILAAAVRGDGLDETIPFDEI
jgi:hypothetical protein